MKTAVALIGIAGLAGAAQAQSWTWMASVSDDSIAPGESTTVTLSVAMTDAAGGTDEVVGLSATIFDTLSNFGGENGEITGWSVLNSLDELTGDLTTSDGTNLFGTNAGQLTVFGPFTSANPIDVLEFTWTANAVGDVEYSTSTDSAVIWIGDPADPPGADAVDAVEVSEATAAWTVVPTPASAALLGLGGLALVRRRR